MPEIDFALRLSCRIGGDDDLAPLLLQLMHQRLCIFRWTKNIPIHSIGLGLGLGLGLGAPLNTT